jgi:hypothetical protein
VPTPTEIAPGLRHEWDLLWPSAMANIVERGGLAIGTTAGLVVGF